MAAAMAAAAPPRCPGRAALPGRGCADMAAAERPDGEVGARPGQRGRGSGAGAGDAAGMGSSGAGGAGAVRGCSGGDLCRCAPAAGGGGRARIPLDEEGLSHLPQRAARLGPQPPAPGHPGRARARAGELVLGAGWCHRARAAPLSSTCTLHSI